uniref:L-serine deaminase n=1 Tax=Magallana gigas TaxID=29159 RepID=K1QRH3_MAGGI
MNAKHIHPTDDKMIANGREVKRCRTGYFKTTGDLSICKPHTICAAEAGLRVKVEGTATSDAVCENATKVPSSREITSYPPIDEIITNDVTHPTEELFFFIYSCAAEAGLRVKVEGTATSDAVCENATKVPSSREITSYPPIDEIITNDVTHPTEGKRQNRRHYENWKFCRLQLEGHSRPDFKYLRIIIRCEPKNSKVMYESVKAGRVVFEESLDTLSDGTSGGVDKNSITFPICAEYVDDWILVDEEELGKAIIFMLQHHHKVVEGAAGMTLGAYMKNPERFSGKKVVVVACGGNIGIEKLKHLLSLYT